MAEFSSSISAGPTSTSTDVDPQASTNELWEVLQTAVPSSAQTDPDAACFLAAEYNSYYTTPSWYTSLPNDAQSYYSSVNAAASPTGHCTSVSPDAFTRGGGSSGAGGGLSKPEIAGVFIGTLAGVAGIAALLFHAIRNGLLPSLFGGRSSTKTAVPPTAAVVTSHPTTETAPAASTSMPPTMFGGRAPAPRFTSLTNEDSNAHGISPAV